MKKRGIKDILAVILFFASALICLSILPKSTEISLVGIAFLIAFMYGVVLIFKGKRFIF